MEVAFHVDPETGQPHIYHHGVSEEEVRQVLVKPGRVMRGRGESRFVYGQTETGRHLKVVYSKRRHGPGIFVISAYDLRGNELRSYRRYRRRRMK